MEKVKDIKVAGQSPVAGLAGSIVNSLEEYPKVKLTVIGAGACNQAVKAIIQSRSIIISKGLDIEIIPGFGSTEIGDKVKTTIVFYIQYK